MPEWKESQDKWSDITCVLFAMTAGVKAVNNSWLCGFWDLSITLNVNPVKE